ncbi:SDR family NAD(P)-dependent oxidoreductase [Vibrio methylphosphonaticus]|uniref:SDR family NAD(P)-dependent oxidoreductase n=1 Tax=Vibrio methylphosphonaticus TaxID=2946866 RepID=UPI002029E102|nr:SDR family NAD(P)-dependent oxidoreductase [Vibrio methylphosphonaticus]MCL9777155.1 SDR family NAD(P)-dependent oxidoreductase [Vibrio methylphosphonaticus]
MNILIIGGSGGIGFALVEHFLLASETTMIHATFCRHSHALVSPKLVWHQLDVTSEQDIQTLAAAIPNIDIVINAVGFLHQSQSQGQSQGPSQGQCMPEKSVSQFSPDFFHKNIQLNTTSTLLLAKHFAQALRSKKPTYFIALSARIGSIEDNQLGGWISYRCSKAALNMAIKTISIEWQYKNPTCCVFSFHPGTTDTALSTPFQSKVPPHKLFPPHLVAQKLVALMNTVTPSDTGKFFSFDGSEIPW